MESLQVIKALWAIKVPLVRPARRALQVIPARRVPQVPLAQQDQRTVAQDLQDLLERSLGRQAEQEIRASLAGPEAVVRQAIRARRASLVIQALLDLQVPPDQLVQLFSAVSGSQLGQNPA